MEKYNKLILREKLNTVKKQVFQQTTKNFKQETKRLTKKYNKVKYNNRMI